MESPKNGKSASVCVIRVDNLFGSVIENSLTEETFLDCLLAEKDMKDKVTLNLNYLFNEEAKARETVKHKLNCGQFYGQAGRLPDRMDVFTWVVVFVGVCIFLSVNRPQQESSDGQRNAVSPGEKIFSAF